LFKGIVSCQQTEEKVSTEKPENHVLIQPWRRNSGRPNNFNATNQKKMVGMQCSQMQPKPVKKMLQYFKAEKE
jgi:hypothetical protein